jgi:D-3-phosphoglycerate dehydrogenase
MTSARIVVPAGFASTTGVANRLREAGHTVIETPPMDGRPWSADQIDQYFRDADVIVVSPNQPCGEEVLRGSRRLRLVASPVIGTDHIDEGLATELGIVVANCPTEEIIVGMAESSVMLMVALRLEFMRKQASLRAGSWRPASSSHILRDAVVGLVGYGRIARAVEQRLQGWQVNIQAYDPYVPGTIPLDDLLRTSDIVSVHSPRTPETVGLIGARELALMKPTAYIINTARGGIVDELALAEAIDTGVIAGAAVDAFVREPVDMDNPLLRCDPNNVILTPHAVGHGLEIGPAGVEMVHRTILRALAGELPEGLINKPVVDAWRTRLSLLD